MEPDRWRQIDELFRAAVDCEPARRAQFLEAACGGDDRLREEIESLLDADQRGGFTEASGYHDAVRLLDNSPPLPGRRIGPYRVVREIGSGGMGTVYLAARDDATFEKQVAIKLIQGGLDAKHIVQQFRSERQILASLDHPNITRLLDGGTTEDGLPYFVMEYIDGAPITEYCDARSLSVVERLRLFQSVCAAVQYAHQNLIIHRDIKPGNVLVTAEGVPRLLDFGIAKLLNPDGSPGASPATITAARFLTPVYASPEQVQGRSITTASDVYSLGVLLYELLTGRRPYRADPSSPAEIERSICEEEPEKPSVTVLNREPEVTKAERRITPAGAASARDTTPEKLRRLLHGDLDNIVLMALRKEPHRRYASAGQFSEDISRHLNNLPVIARPDKRSYRLSKFVRRNRAGVIAAALLLFTLTGGLAATLWQARVVRQERDHAQLEQAKANRIKSFLKDILTFSSPEYTSPNPDRNRNATVSEVVDDAARRAETELADQPEVLEEVQSTIGGVYVSEGRFDQAEPFLRAARERSIRLYGLYSHQTTEVSGELANALLGKGTYVEADALFRQDIEIERELLRRGQGSVVNLAYALGGYGALLDQRADKASEAYLREALKYSSAFTGKARVFVAMLYNDLSNEVVYRGDLDDSERCLRASLEEYRKLPPGTYVEMATTLSNLGGLLISRGRFDEAEPFVREGLALRQRILGNAHTGTAGALYRLSDLLYHQGKYDEAEAYLREALEIRTRLVPGGNQLIGKVEGVLGDCLTLQRRYVEAEPLLLDSYSILESTTTASDPRRSEAAQRLNALYRSWGRSEQAEKYAAPRLPATAAKPSSDVPIVRSKS